MSRTLEMLDKALDLARKERTLGQRSLIEVLAGETSLINAQAQADQARRPRSVF